MDVGAEPFTDMDFLLAETERLLSFGAGELEVADSPDAANAGTGSGK